jgi:hypothetical protein
MRAILCIISLWPILFAHCEKDQGHHDTNPVDSTTVNNGWEGVPLGDSQGGRIPPPVDPED